MSHTVKRLKTLANSNPAANAEERAKQWRAQRNDLGETFGTKKAKSQIKAEERNKVDVGAMEGIKGHLMGSIHQREEAVGESGCICSGPLRLAFSFRILASVQLEGLIMECGHLRGCGADPCSWSTGKHPYS